LSLPCGTIKIKMGSGEKAVTATSPTRSVMISKEFWQVLS
jgi:hypothetical protein